MSIAMEDVNIRPYILKIVSQIAKTRHVSENEVINDLLLRGIIDIGEEDGEKIFEDGVDIEIVAEEFGQTKEELINELDEARAEIAAGKGIELDVDNLDKMFES